MANYTIEQVDYLREKADVSYEEAVALLEQYQGDLTRCLIDLERQGRIRKGTASKKSGSWGGDPYQGHYYGGQTYDNNGKEYKKPFILDGKTVRSYLFSRIKVTKGDMVIANLPVVYLLVALFMAPHLMFLSVLAMFVLGYRIKWVRKDQPEDTPKDREVYEFVDKAAQNIKRTASSFANAVKQEVYGEQKEGNQESANAAAPGADYANQEEEDNDPSDMTIE